MEKIFKLMCVGMVLVTFANCQVQSDIKTHDVKKQAPQLRYYPKNSKQYQFTNMLKTPQNTQCSPEEQIGDYIRRIYQTSDGDLWFATNSFGTARYNNEYLTYYNQDNELPGNQVTAFLETKDKKFWIATNGGLANLTDGIFTQIKLDQSSNKDFITSMMEDQNGTLWVGSLNGLFKKNNYHFEKVHLPKTKVVNPNPRFSLDLVRAMIQDKQGNYWYALDGGGVVHFDGKQYTNITKDDGLCDNNIVSILEDKKGNIWFGSMFGGLCRFDGKQYKTYNEENGTIGNNEVWTMYEDSKGVIWFSSEGFGVYRLIGDELTNFSEKQGLKVKAVQSIFEDKQGKIWVGGGGGLYLMVGGNQFLNVQKNGPWDPC